MNLLNDIEKDLVENPTPRVPVCLVLDTSYSMAGTPINELNRGLHNFYQFIKEDDDAKFSVESSIIAFGKTAQKFLDFENVDKQVVPKLSVSSGTSMGKAIQLALDTLEDRTKKYRAAGVDYYLPWIIIMTDGMPTDNMDSANSRVRKMISDEKLVCIPVGIGPMASIEVLDQLSGSNKAFRLQGLKFNEFFNWLSSGILNVISSLPGESIPMDLEGVKEWAHN